MVLGHMALVTADPLSCDLRTILLCAHSFMCTVLHFPKKLGLALIRAGLTTRWPLWLLALDKAPVEGDRLAARIHVRS